MIFITVGAQMPFDRLVAAVDKWAKDNQRSDVFAQIGVDGIPPEHIEWTAKLDPLEFRKKMNEATLVISHAGMGSILTALESNTPILVLPRRGALRETRNDHQVATAKWLGEQGRVAVAMDEQELHEKLNSLDELTASGQIQKWASDDLIAAVRTFINAN